MESKIIYDNLKRLFPNNLQNINIKQIPKNHQSFNQFLQKLINNQLPHIPIQELHSLCQKQQKNVMNKLIEIKHVDIYHEISKVCPNQRNLKDLSIQQISKKINDYSQKQSDHLSYKSKDNSLRDITYQQDLEQQQMKMEQQCQYQMLGEKDLQIKMQRLQLDEIESYSYHHHDNIYHNSFLNDFDEQKQDHNHLFWKKNNYFEDN